MFGRGPTDDAPPSRIDLAGVLRRTGDLLRPALPSWIRLELVIQTEPLWLDGVETMLEQALVNLGLNARDQITRADPGRRGVITFQAGSLVGGERPLILEVRYEAVGPTSGAAAGATARTTWSGSNPGIAMVTDVVRRHGGVIDAEPHPQGGTVVRLRFPSARREAAAG